VCLTQGFEIKEKQTVRVKMLSKFLRLSNCANLIKLSSLRELNLVRTVRPIRFYTTENPQTPKQEPAAQPKTEPAKPAKELPGKGKGEKIHDDSFNNKFFKENNF
jgi:hypothetical protein